MRSHYGQGHYRPIVRIQHPEWCCATRAQKKEDLERESELAKRKAEEDAEREDAAKKKQKVIFLDSI
jgi:hypothetical protein